MQGLLQFLIWLLKFYLKVYVNSVRILVPSDSSIVCKAESTGSGLNFQFAKFDK